MVKAFSAERSVQANSKAWHNAMQSEQIQSLAIAHALAKRARRHVGWLTTCDTVHDGKGTWTACLSPELLVKRV